MHANGTVANGASGGVAAHALSPLAHRKDAGVVVAAVEDQADARALQRMA